MFKYDSTHGQFKGDVCIKDGMLCINGKLVNVYCKYVTFHKYFCNFNSISLFLVRLETWNILH